MRSGCEDAIDRTEYKRIEAEIGRTERSADPFVCAMRMTHQPMVLTNARLPDNPLVFVNDAFCQLTGYARSELLGHNCRLLQGPGTGRPEVDRMRDAVVRQASIDVELLNYTKAGQAFWNRLHVSPVFDDDGRLTYFFASQTDVTLQVEADRRLREINESLEQRVAEALAEREGVEGRLRQSQKMEAMGSLTGGVAHDFNNLLTPIVGTLDRLMTRGVGSERERRLIEGALQSAERAKTLVQRLLAFARRQPLQPVALDVGALVQGMAELLRSTLGPTIDVRIDLAVDLPAARADANQLEMALLNLAVNAGDAMPSGGCLTIRASRESVSRTHPSAGLEHGHYIRLTVTDTGTGMDAATCARAVEPFFSTKGIGKGTGLGLSMVHGLVAQLGGGLTIDSRLGEGTTMTLWLPVSAETVEPVEAVEGTRATSRLVGTRGCALLVDDEDLVRLSTATMLADLGFEVLEASSSGDALRLLYGGAAVSLLVTDHLMPGMSGVDLVREARSLRPGLPALIVSGYTEVGELAPDLPRLVKPFRAVELAKCLETLMQRLPSIG